MPELPEVETVVRELKSKIVGKTIEDYTVFWHKTFVKKCDRDIKQQTIREIGRQGKYILIKLDNCFLVIHLRMTGQVLLFEQHPNEIEAAHNRVAFTFTDGSGFIFNDTRKFGRIYQVNQADEVLEKVGIDAIDPNLTVTQFKTFMGKSRKPVKTFLMDQASVSGMGNIYTDEVLFRSKVHPASVTSKIPALKQHLIFENMQQVLAFAIKNMGSTISDYRDPNGNLGNNQKFFNVYQQQGKECVQCKSIIEKIRFAGRGTHFCPKCQKIYK